MTCNCACDGTRKRSFSVVATLMYVVTVVPFDTTEAFDREEMSIINFHATESA